MSKASVHELLLKENDRLYNAWIVKHEAMVEAEKFHREYFTASQKRMTELRAEIERLKLDEAVIVDTARIAHDELVACRKELAMALKKIEEFGHSHGHGRGYTCANMAEEALGKLNDKL